MFGVSNDCGNDLTDATLAGIRHGPSIYSVLVDHDPRLAMAEIMRIYDYQFDPTAFTFEYDFRLTPTNWQARF